MSQSMAAMIAGKTGRIVSDLGYDLVDLEYVKEGANWYLRYFIEPAPPDRALTTEDCQKVSEALSAWLDAEDPIPVAYFLEVSSPGIQRALKKDRDFQRFQGEAVEVRTFAPFLDKKLHLGRLGPVTDETLTIRQDGRDLTIPRELIAGVNLYWDYHEEG